MMKILTRIFRRTARESVFHDHVNPDGSLGGRVAETASVHPTATIERYGKVLPGAVVEAHQLIKDGDFVFANGKVLRFD